MDFHSSLRFSIGPLRFCIGYSIRVKILYRLCYTEGPSSSSITYTGNYTAEPRIGKGEFKHRYRVANLVSLFLILKISLSFQQFYLSNLCKSDSLPMAEYDFLSRTRDLIP
jgi:hypothetical protein